MTSTIHHPVAIPSRGLIICEMDEDTTEQKTILEIGGVARPRPTYILPAPRAHSIPSSMSNQSPFMSHWKADHHDIVSPAFQAFTDFQEQKIVRLANNNWIQTSEKNITTQSMLSSRGNIFSFISLAISIF